VHIETITRSNELPARAVRHPLGNNIISAPKAKKLDHVAPLSTFPIETSIVNETEPSFLKKFAVSPSGVVEDRIIALHPK
jgi:hypothetical protein